MINGFTINTNKCNTKSANITFYKPFTSCQSHIVFQVSHPYLELINYWKLTKLNLQNI